MRYYYYQASDTIEPDIGICGILVLYYQAKYDRSLKQGYTSRLMISSP